MSSLFEEKNHPIEHDTVKVAMSRSRTALARFKHFKANKSKRLTLLVIVLLSYGLWLLVLGVVAPYLSVRYGPQWLSEQLSRPVTLTNMQIDPLKLTVTLEGFSIKEADGKQDFVSFVSLQADLAFWESIFQGKLILSWLELNAAYVNVARLAEEKPEVEAVFNFSDILTHLAKSSPVNTKESDTESPLFAVAVKHFGINQASVKLTDKPSGLIVNYPSISTTLSDFDSGNLLVSVSKAMAHNTQKPRLINHYQVIIKDDNDSLLSLSGQFQLNPFQVKGDIHLKALPLAHYWQGINHLFDFNIDKGRLSGNAHYRLGQAKAPEGKTKLNWKISKAKLAISDFSLISKDKLSQNTPSIRLENLAFSGINADSNTMAIIVDKVQTDGGSLVLANTKAGVDLVHLLQGTMGKDADSTNAAFDENITVNSLSETATTTALAEKSEPSPKGQSQNQQSSDEQDTQAQTQDVATSVEPNTQPATAALDAQQEPWQVTLNQLDITHYRIALTEHTASLNPKTWVFSEVSLTTGKIVSTLTSPIDYQLAITINDASQLTSQGQLDVLKQSLDTELKLTDVMLTNLQAYVEPFVNLTIEDGRFSTQGHLNISPERHIRYQGQAKLNSLSINDNLLMQPLLNWDVMAANGIDYNSSNNSLMIEDVSVDKLFARLIIAKDKQTNISQLVKTANAEGTPNLDDPSAKPISKTVVKDTLSKIEQKIAKLEGDTEVQPLHFTIKRIAIENSSAFFADNSLTPNFGSGIEDLTGEIIGLSSAVDSRAKVNLNGKIDKYAPVVLKGQFNPFIANPYLDVLLSFKKVELTSVNPYSGIYAGYYIDKGQLSLDLNYQLTENQLQGKNHVVIEQLKLGKPSNSSLASSLPITLAIALLQDSHGVIDLGIEVTGDVNAPSFSFGNIIFAAIGNAITKVVTSPFTLLANLIGGDEEELDIISFDYGQSILVKKQRSTLKKLAKALKERPQLTLELRGRVDVAHDSQALAETKLHQQLASLAGMPITALPTTLSASKFPAQGPLVDALKYYVETELKVSAADMLSTLESEKADLSQEELTTGWHIALYNLARQHQDVDNEALVQLAQDRAAQVKNYLIEQGQIDPSRLFLLNSKMAIKQQHSSQVLLSLDAG
jgi:hypothetical protein